MLELPKSVPNNETVGDFNLGRTLALAQLYLSQDILVAVSIAKEPKNASLPLSENTNIFKASLSRPCIFSFIPENSVLIRAKYITKNLKLLPPIG